MRDGMSTGLQASMDLLHARYPALSKSAVAQVEAAVESGADRTGPQHGPAPAKVQYDATTRLRGMQTAQVSASASRPVSELDRRRALWFCRTPPPSATLRHMAVQLSRHVGIASWPSSCRSYLAALVLAGALGDRPLLGTVYIGIPVAAALWAMGGNADDTGRLPVERHLCHRWKMRHRRSTVPGMPPRWPVSEA